jgi:hypothetical protein
VSSGQDELERLLPTPGSDVVTPAMRGSRVAHRFPLEAPVTYDFFEGRRERYGWFPDPSPEEDEVVDPELRVSHGRRFWFILLRHGRSGWRVDQAVPCDSLDSARVLAAMGWAGRMGWLVTYRDGTTVVGPHLADLADPARYLGLVKAAARPGKPNG